MRFPPEIRCAFMQAFRERPQTHGDEWAEEHLTIGGWSPEPGKLSFATRPYLREPTRAATTEGGVSFVMMMAPVQGGKTMVFDCAAAYHAINNIGPILVLSDTDGNANDYAENRLNVLFETNACTAAVLSPDKTKNKRNSKQLTNTTTIWILGAQTKKNLQRRSIRTLIGDEIWTWPEGHIAEAIARTTAFTAAARIVIGSQAGEQGQEMCEYWEATDRREWCWTCAGCGEEQPWAWEMAAWDDCRTPSGEYDMAAILPTARYRCRKCGSTYPPGQGTLNMLNRASRYVPSKPDAPPGKRGYHFTALSFLPVASLVEEYLKAQNALKDGNETPLKIFMQKRMARTWTEEMSVAEIELPESGARMETPWPEMGWFTKRGIEDARPEEEKAAPVAALTIDVMKDYFYYVVRGWNSKGESMLLDCGRVNKWAQLADKQRTYGILPNCVFVDYGYETDTVIAECRKNGWMPVKGTDTKMWTHVRKNRKVLLPYSPRQNTKVVGGKTSKMCLFSANAMKDIIHFSRIRTQNGREPRWMVPDDVPREYLAHLCAERRVERQPGRWVWEPVGSRPNHMLDCESMQVLFALQLNLPIAADYRPE